MLRIFLIVTDIANIALEASINLIRQLVPVQQTLHLPQ